MKIKIGPYKFTVVFDKKKQLEAQKKLKQGDTFGMMDPFSQTIWVDPDQAEDSKADTLLHEVLHAVWLAAGAHESKPKTEEAVISTLTPGLLCALRNNPNLVKFLVGK